KRYLRSVPTLCPEVSLHSVYKTFPCIVVRNEFSGNEYEEQTKQCAPHVSRMVDVSSSLFIEHVGNDQEEWSEDEAGNERRYDEESDFDIRCKQKACEDHCRYCSRCAEAPVVITVSVFEISR